MLGCEYGQGFLFSRPVGADRIREVLAGWADVRAAVVGRHYAA
jgi:EAL domain-containing protein (putative c-di-GMP-specific phosphodiesterase class I)